MSIDWFVDLSFSLRVAQMNTGNRVTVTRFTKIDSVEFSLEKPNHKNIWRANGSGGQPQQHPISGLELCLCPVGQASSTPEESPAQPLPMPPWNSWGTERDWVHGSGQWVVIVWASRASLSASQFCNGASWWLKRCGTRRSNSFPPFSCARTVFKTCTLNVPFPGFQTKRISNLQNITIL